MMRIASRPGLLALALPLLVVACAGPGGFGERIPEAERLAYAEALAPQPGDPEASAEKLEAFVVAYPNSHLADDAFEQLARLDFVAGGREAAFARLREATLRYPSGDRVDEIRLRLALWETERDASDEARRWLDEVRPQGLGPAEQRLFFRLRVRVAESNVERLVYLSRLRALRAAALAEEQDEEEAGRALSADSPGPPEELAQFDEEIDGLLLGLSGNDLLRVLPDLGAEVPGARVRLVLSWRALVAGDLPLAGFWLEEAERYAMTPADRERMRSLALRLGTGDGDGEELVLPTFREAAARPWPDLADVEIRLGVVLPLTGRYAPFGEEALRGLLLAAGVFDTILPPAFVPPPPPDPLEPIRADAGVETSELEAFVEPEIPPASAALDAPGGPEAPAASEAPATVPRAGGGVQLVIRDSGGSPDRAAAAVRELAADAEILAILGPIFSAESEAAAREAEALGVPLLTLSNRPQLSAERDNIFRLRMTPDDEIDHLVDYAIHEVGAQNFAILYPMNRYGRGMRSRYWEAVVARGGKMVAAAGYEPEATDFKGSIRGMVGFDLITPNERVALVERSKALRRGRRLEPEVAALLKEILYTQLGPDGEGLPPVVDFDALFIPDGHEKIQLIAPQLAFHEVEGVQLLGSSDWNDPELIAIGREHVTGAVVSTRFFEDSRFAIVQDFVADYRESFGSEPDEFSASAFDALNIVLTQAALGYDSRTEVRDGIQRIYGFPGVSGVTSILPDGNARKRPFLLEVTRRRFLGLD